MSFFKEVIDKTWCVVELLLAMRLDLLWEFLKGDIDEILNNNNIDGGSHSGVDDPGIPRVARSEET